MLEHLIDFEPEVGMPTDFTPIEKADVVQTVDAKASTADWLKSLGAVDTEEVVSQAQTEAARKSFTNLVTAAPAEITHTALAEVKTPKAVQHLVGMLTAYEIMPSLVGSEMCIRDRSHSMGQKRGVGVWWGLNSQIIGLSKYPICYNKGTDSR